MPNEPTKKPTNRALADCLGISVRRVNELKRAGMPGTSLAAAEAWRLSQASQQRQRGDTAEELRIRRIRLLEQQERRVRIDADEREARLVSRDELDRETMEVVSACRAGMLNLVGVFPPQAEGLPAGAIAKILHDALFELLDGMCHGDFYDSPKSRREAAAFPTMMPTRFSPAVSELRQRLASVLKQNRNLTRLHNEHTAKNATVKTDKKSDSQARH
jgi:hypothetical protein